MPYKFRVTPDIAFVSLFIMLIICIIIPLPGWLIDLLISMNITATILILIISLNISSAVELPSFPSILLITTLFRLSLNVASTRAILTEGDAGRVISAFGNFVIAGNYFAGAVVFLIITIIQIVVVTKGAERVAEVSARFTLDAMPGKQMSIDAELRSGNITQEEAKRRRTNLSIESQFFGSMDGAMKFVKGDAIAGILISCINVIGGISTGTIMKNMSLSEAVSRYTILSIGDGLVSQIPSLIISISAGIIITRISTTKKAGLGKELFINLTRKPITILIASIIALLFSLLPYIPFLPFFMMGAIFFAAYKKLNREQIDENSENKAENIESKNRGDTQEIRQNEKNIFADPLILSVSQGIIDDKSINTADNILLDIVPEVRKVLLERYGFKLAGVRIVKNDETEPKISLKIFGVNAFSITFLPNSGFVKTVKSREPVISELYDGSYIVYSSKNDDENEILSLRDVLCEILITQIYKNFRELFGIQETSEIIEELSVRYPALVRETIPKSIGINTLSEVLKNLLSEGISIRNMKGILETIQRFAPFEKNPNLLSEFVRVYLSRQICQNLSIDNRLPIYVLSPEINKIIQDSLADIGGEQVLSISPDSARKIIESIKRLRAGSEIPITIMTDFDTRRFVRRILEYELPFVNVLSFKEICSDVKIEFKGTVGT